MRVGLGGWERNKDKRTKGHEVLIAMQLQFSEKVTYNTSASLAVHALPIWVIQKAQNESVMTTEAVAFHLASTQHSNSIDK